MAASKSRCTRLPPTFTASAANHAKMSTQTAIQRMRWPVAGLTGDTIDSTCSDARSAPTLLEGSHAVRGTRRLYRECSPELCPGHLSHPRDPSRLDGRLQVRERQHLREDQRQRP